MNSDQGHCEGGEFIAPAPPASMLFLTANAGSPITGKSKIFADHRHQHQNNPQPLEPQPAYSDGSNIYYVINIDRRRGTTSAASPKGDTLPRPHPNLTPTMVVPGPDSSYV